MFVSVRERGVGGTGREFYVKKAYLALFATQLSYFPLIRPKSTTYFRNSNVKRSWILGLEEVPLPYHQGALSRTVVDARALSLLYGHPADGWLRRQLRLRRKLLHQDLQYWTHLPVHLMHLDWRRYDRRQEGWVCGRNKHNLCIITVRG